ALRELASRGAKLLVTVDCGAAAHQEVALARDLGIDVIICDHHQAPEVRPPALAVLNPVVRDAGFPFAGLCAAGVAFYLLMGARMLLRESGDQGPDLRRYLDLVALGTVADLVPLLEENRALVKYGLREIARRDRPGIHALLEVSGVDAVTVSSLGFGLGPRINASGRLADATSAVELLASRDPAAARRLAVALDGHNRDRRALEQAMYEEADRQIQAMPDRDTRRSFVLASEGWHSGVVGIVASRLVERYYRPVVLLAIENGWCRGSARGIPGVHLFESLQRCATLLERFGGHRMAAGLTIREGRVAELAQRFEASISDSTSAEDFRPVISVDATVRLDEVTPEVVDDLGRLEPHGPGNPRPVLCARGVPVTRARIVGERHLKLDLRVGGSGRMIEAIGFRLAERVADTNGEIDILFSPELSVWEGRERLQLIIRDFEKVE
ncbi:MAG: single-stranded-DNA-specific exonuclease RecJ, partial [Candidatus Binatia bacterium]